jgi:hypothetical protein
MVFLRSLSAFECTLFQLFRILLIRFIVKELSLRVGSGTCRRGDCLISLRIWPICSDFTLNVALFSRKRSYSSKPLLIVFKPSFMYPEAFSK